MNVTESGIKCQRWNTNSPHTLDAKFSVPSNFPDATMVEASNYCRNPIFTGDTAQPWCYTTNPGKRWENCDVPKCQKG